MGKTETNYENLRLLFPDCLSRSKFKDYSCIDESMCFVVCMQLMRLFMGEPVWTAYNRPQEDHPARQEYIKSLTQRMGVQLAAY